MKKSLKQGLPIFAISSNMRAGLILIGPLLPILKEEYGISTLTESILAATPLLCFSLSAILMRSISRLGNTNRIISYAITVLTLSLFLRTTFDIASVLIFSISLGISVAVLNYMLPVWVKENNTGNAGLLTGIYAAVMGSCAAISLAITAPLAQMTSYSWRLAMLPWFIIGALTALWWWIKIPSSSTTEIVESKESFWANPLFKNRSAWSITLFFGLLNMIHYASATWLPTILLTKGFTLVNAGILVAVATLVGSLLSLAVPHFASKQKDFRLVLVVFSLFLAVSYLAIAMDSGMRLWIWVILGNIGVYVTFSIALFLVVFRATDASKTKSLSIMMQSVGYIMATASPIVLGLLFDISNNWSYALYFIVALAGIQVIVALKAGSREKV
ncbi:MAG: MFS transporter [Candidatus Planktophila sp.]|jgi:MFS transporter, CP family, cyanate transporter|tara:strand:- start:855 stop:2018 length:1164 start_codon:yes stop_codon:yes gene_type:complete